MVKGSHYVDTAIRRLLDTSYPVGTFVEDMATFVLPKYYDASGTRSDFDRERHQRRIINNQNRIEEMLVCYHSPQVPAEYRGTAYAAIMAVQGWEQHDKPTRNSKGAPPRARVATAVEKSVNYAATTGGYPLSAALMNTPASAGKSLSRKVRDAAYN